MTTGKEMATMCCVALELSKSSWLAAFTAPDGGKAVVQKLPARDIDGLVAWITKRREATEERLGAPHAVTVCFEIGYDGFWIARMLLSRGIDTIVFDPASFLRPRRGRVAKTDRLDAEDMCRVLRTWLSGDHSVASSVQIQSIEEEDAKRIGRERKYLVQQRGRVISRIKGLLALHGIYIDSVRITKQHAAQLADMRTAEGSPLPPFLRRDIQRMLEMLELLNRQVAALDAERREAVNEGTETLPCAGKVRKLSKMGGIGQVSATVLVTEVFHREFDNRRQLASFLGLAPSPYASGDTMRDRGISKAGTKIARRTLVELAWFWLRYQPQSALSEWWRERFAETGMRGRKVGIVALARKLAIALWRYLEFDVVPEGAQLKT